MNQSWLLLLLAAAFSLPALTSLHPASAEQAALPDRVLVGYWHNFAGGAGFIPLSAVPEAYDVIDIAFALPVPGSTSRMTFVPDAATTVEAFKQDVRMLQNRGQRVLISIGGATATIRLETQADEDAFVASMIDIIEGYGFDGLDIDLEGHSLALESGDTDFRAPTTPVVVHLISGIRRVSTHFGDDFVLTAAPETAYVQGGFGSYGGIWGAYLPVIHALRDRLDLLHVQHYNTGTMFGLDGRVYTSATPDFHVAMTEMLLQGFPVAHNPQLFFPPLRPDQVAIGLPATTLAAGSGFTAPGGVHAALDYLILGKAFGGGYTLRQSAGYPSLRGLMTWSINWDATQGYSFAAAHRAYLDALAPIPSARDASVDVPPVAVRLLPPQPSPMRDSGVIRYHLSRDADVRVALYQTTGQLVETLASGYQRAGSQAIRVPVSHLPSGVYLYRITVDGEGSTGTLHVQH